MGRKYGAAGRAVCPLAHTTRRFAAERSGDDAASHAVNVPKEESMPRLLLALAVMIVSLPARAVEEPAFDVERKLADDIEIRRYGAYVVAEVVVAGPAEKAGGQAFPMLSGYIFGKNRGARKLEMTAPVTQAAAPVKMEMTAPVTQAATRGGFVVQFVLPKTVTLDTAPEPDDERVRLREVPAARVAVIRYSGFWSDANYERHRAKLEAALAAASLTASGPPVYSRYNPPFTPWFLRRNEIWMPLPPE
jgi:hypothetical protein